MLTVCVALPPADGTLRYTGLGVAARPEVVPPPTVTLTWKFIWPAAVVAVTVAVWVPNGRAAPLTLTLMIPVPPGLRTSQFSPTTEDVASTAMGMPLNVTATGRLAGVAPAPAIGTVKLSRDGLTTRPDEPPLLVPTVRLTGTITLPNCVLAVTVPL